MGGCVKYVLIRDPDGDLFVVHRKWWEEFIPTARAKLYKEMCAVLKESDNIHELNQLMNLTREVEV